MSLTWVWSWAEWELRVQFYSGLGYAHDGIILNAWKTNSIKSHDWLCVCALTKLRIKPRTLMMWSTGFHLSIHSLYLLSLLGRVEPEAYPRRLWVQGRVHPSTHSFTHYRQFSDASHPAKQVLGLGRNLDSTEKAPDAWKNMKSLQDGVGKRTLTPWGVRQTLTTKKTKERQSTQRKKNMQTTHIGQWQEP